MRSSSKYGIQLPQVPKSLPVQEVAQLEDHGEYARLLLAEGDFTQQED